MCTNRGGGVPQRPRPPFPPGTCFEDMLGTDVLDTVPLRHHLRAQCSEQLWVNHQQLMYDVQHMSCHVMSCHVMSCHAMSCHVRSMQHTMMRAISTGKAQVRVVYKTLGIVVLDVCILLHQLSARTGLMAAWQEALLLETHRCSLGGSDAALSFKLQAMIPPSLNACLKIRFASPHSPGDHSLLFGLVNARPGTNTLSMSLSPRPYLRSCSFRLPCPALPFPQHIPLPIA